ncbi:virulence-associated E family protein [Bradyrhizobium sp. th.b2]|uniref:virulence-associated E family protein n=1 Tax=Bradyrhizobium sp. th-b2 TaxID=172088 RepID=UPI0004228849|nr:virulence-associated E family protein [Bradyrhizobium sp. th.b2]
MSEPDATTDLDTHSFVVTFFENEFAASKRVSRLTLPELRDLILRETAIDKMKLPWLKLASFGGTRSEKNCLRTNANLDEITGIETDYDAGLIPFDDAIEAMRKAGVRCLLYTSASHVAGERERWRILAPLSKSREKKIRENLVACVNGLFGGVLADESFTLSQAYLFGSAENPDHRAIVLDGDFLDLREDLYAGAIFKKNSNEQKPDDANDKSSIDWTKVAEHAGWLKSAADLPEDFNAKGKLIIGHAGNLDDLRFDLDQANLASKPYQSWSEVSFALTAIFKNDKRFSNEQIAAALLCDLPCNQHILRQRDQRRAVGRLLGRCHQQLDNNDIRKVRLAGEPDWRECRKDGSPRPSMHNARLAVCVLGIECKYDTFHGKMLFGYRGDTTQHALEKLLGEVSDNGIIALRQLMSDRFGFDLTEKHVRDAVTSLALEHCFDPIVDMLAEAEGNWDRKPRLDKMAVDYFNCSDTPLNAACARKTMIAAVARARTPGIKFDQILVLESEEGYEKSTAWRVPAGDDNFSDEKIIGREAREVQEQLAGIWIHESADLSGLRKAEVETVKAYASRQVDIARPAYGHFVRKQPRHSIEVGTTNSDEYLQSQTGNRRFWTLLVQQPIDIDKLKRDRLQLWGEAAYYHSQGESLVLDKQLWAVAGREQEHRRVKDPWENVLRDIPEHTPYCYFQDGVKHEGLRNIIDHDFVDKEQVSAADLLAYVLNLAPQNQRVEHTMRLSLAMKAVGWKRKKNGYVTIKGQRVRGYYRRTK